MRCLSLFFIPFLAVLLLSEVNSVAQESGKQKTIDETFIEVRNFYKNKAMNGETYARWVGEGKKVELIQKFYNAAGNELMIPHSDQPIELNRGTPGAEVITVIQSGRFYPSGAVVSDLNWSTVIKNADLLPAKEESTPEKLTELMTRAKLLSEPTHQEKTRSVSCSTCLIDRVLLKKEPDLTPIKVSTPQVEIKSTVRTEKESVLFPKITENQVRDLADQNASFQFILDYYSEINSIVTSQDPENFLGLAKHKLYALAFSDLFKAKQKLVEASKKLSAKGQAFRLRLFFQRYLNEMDSFGCTSTVGIVNDEASVVNAYQSLKPDQEPELDILDSLTFPNGKKLNGCAIPKIMIELEVIDIHSHKMIRKADKPLLELRRRFYGPGTGRSVISADQVLKEMKKLSKK